MKIYYEIGMIYYEIGTNLYYEIGTKPRMEGLACYYGASLISHKVLKVTSRTNL